MRLREGPTWTPIRLNNFAGNGFTPSILLDTRLVPLHTVLLGYYQLLKC
jgi:hypothetical protein